MSVDVHAHEGPPHSHMADNQYNIVNRGKGFKYGGGGVTMIALYSRGTSLLKKVIKTLYGVYCKIWVKYFSKFWYHTLPILYMSKIVYRNYTENKEKSWRIILVKMSKYMK